MDGTEQNTPCAKWYQKKKQKRTQASVMKTQNISVRKKKKKKTQKNAEGNLSTYSCECDLRGSWWYAS